ncbi:hypothetical protein BGZ65_001573 [Modicella reniformis]|uniref:F-box domain-containing protein n=1 Tax=Modicella reniformis TaxID=1440133 RepID=A0A9P6MBG0_9FUNG|nr:hypothetical protein BGZ65_001573 [Modicella reniformis]
MAGSPRLKPLCASVASVASSHDSAKRRVHHDLVAGGGASSVSGAHCPISQLPFEIAFLVLCNLPYRSLVAMSRVDRYWRQLTFQQDGVLWYRLCQRHGFLPAPAPAPAPAPVPEPALALASSFLDSTQHHWTLTEAMNHRPGLARALLQSRKRLAPNDVAPNTSLSHGSIPTSLVRLADLQDQQSCDQHDFYPSARQQFGRVESWRDYFETLLILEREWIEGKPTVKELRGHEEAVLCVKSLSYGERIVSGDRLGYLKIWCAVTAKCLKTIKRHMMGISCFAAQGDLLVSGSWDSTVTVWRQVLDDPYLKPLKIVDLGEQVMSMDLDDNLDLVIGAVSGAVMVTSIKTFSFIDTFRCPIPTICTAVALNQSKVLATIGLNYYAWDRTSKAQVSVIGDAHFENISCMRVDVGHRLVFTGSQDSKVRVFSWESKPMLLRQYGGHRSGVRCMTLQDNMIITGSSDKTAMITFRGRHESNRLDASSLDSLFGQEDVFDEDVERVTEPVSLPHPTNVNSVDADTSLVVTGADDGVVRIFDFGYDLWRPPTPSSPRLCGQASLISSTSSICVLMSRPGRNKVSLGNRRQAWGTRALAVLTRTKSMLNESLAQAGQVATLPPLAWMSVDEIYQRMVEWDLQPVSQGSTPRVTLNLALHMMANSDPPTILLDSTVSPHRFALK